MDLLDAPIFFHSNRVWRCYTGGLLLDRLLGHRPETDGYMPEEWLASSTPAENAEHTQGPEEGLSRVRLADGGRGPLLRDALGSERLEVLCKFLDSAVRLPIQCHPDQAFARKHYHSEHGKTESWLVLGTRVINGEQPYLLIGFKPGVSRTDFTTAVHAQDVAALEGMLHRIPVQAGDCWLIPGRVPHAIGPGVLMLEVQEPSDWVVQVEKTCAGTALSERDCWGPLDPATALECFDYTGVPFAELQKSLAMRSQLVTRSATGTHERLAAQTTTDAFHIDLLRLNGAYRFVPDTPRHIAIVNSGSGQLTTGGHRRRIVSGDTFFCSSRIPTLDFVPDAGAPLTIYVVTD